MTVIKLATLPYLNAVINESTRSSYLDVLKLGFRMAPVVSTGLRREVTVDCTIGGHRVPAGVPYLSSSTNP